MNHPGLSSLVACGALGVSLPGSSPVPSSENLLRFIITIEVESVSRDAAVVRSSQDWSRVVSGSDGKDARIKTGVTHRETWRKADGQWKIHIKLADSREHCLKCN
jgi:hypothetical protein